MLGYIVTLLDKISGYDVSMIYHHFMSIMCECASQDTITESILHTPTQADVIVAMGVLLEPIFRGRINN